MHIVLIFSYIFRSGAVAALAILTTLSLLCFGFHGNASDTMVYFIGFRLYFEINH
jgi:hypothetical protein